MKVLLLSADAYRVVNEGTGEILEGATLFYVNNYRDPSPDVLGLKPTKVSAPLSILTDIKRSSIQLPALADIEIGSRPGAQNKATIMVFGVQVLESVELFAGSK